MCLGCFIRAAAFILLGIACALSAESAEQSTVDTLIADCRLNLASKQEKAERILEKLQSLRSTFTQAQNEEFHNCYGSYLSLKEIGRAHV